MEITALTLRTNTLIAGAFWAVLTGAGSLWFNSSQSHIQRQFEQDVIPELPVVTRMKAKLLVAM